MWDRDWDVSNLAGCFCHQDFWLVNGTSELTIALRSTKKWLTRYHQVREVVTPKNREIAKVSTMSFYFLMHHCSPVIWTEGASTAQSVNLTKTFVKQKKSALVEKNEGLNRIPSQPEFHTFWALPEILGPPPPEMGSTQSQLSGGGVSLCWTWNLRFQLVWKSPEAGCVWRHLAHLSTSRALKDTTQEDILPSWK